MELAVLKEIPPWDWPGDTGAVLAGIVRNPVAPAPDRLLAAELAGDFTVMGDEVADALLSVLRDRAESEPLRARAAVSLGPVLEEADTEGFEAYAEAPISEPTFRGIQAALHGLYEDTSVPQEVRRRVLEAAVRAPQEWHREAIRAALASADAAWRLTAVFCTRFVNGFEREIVVALASTDPDIRYEAVRAAATWSVEAAWPHVVALVGSGATEKPMLLAAIDAVASIRPESAAATLGDLLDSEDEEIVEAVHEAMDMAEGGSGRRRRRRRRAARSELNYRRGDSRAQDVANFESATEGMDRRPQAPPSISCPGADGPRAGHEPGEAGQARQSQAGAVEAPLAAVHRRALLRTLRQSPPRRHPV